MIDSTFNIACSCGGLISNQDSLGKQIKYGWDVRYGEIGYITITHSYIGAWCDNCNEEFLFLETYSAALEVSERSSLVRARAISLSFEDLLKEVEQMSEAMRLTDPREWVRNFKEGEK